jgi:hypothetical protein
VYTYTIKCAEHNNKKNVSNMRVGCCPVAVLQLKESSSQICMLIFFFFNIIFIYNYNLQKKKINL